MLLNAGIVLGVEDGIADGPAVVFEGRTGESETLGQKRRFERCVGSDVGVSIVDLTGMVGFVAITVCED